MSFNARMPHTHIIQSPFGRVKWFLVEGLGSIVSCVGLLCSLFSPTPQPQCHEMPFVRSYFSCDCKLLQAIFNKLNRKLFLRVSLCVVTVCVSFHIYDDVVDIYTSLHPLHLRAMGISANWKKWEWIHSNATRTRTWWWWGPKWLSIVSLHNVPVGRRHIKIECIFVSSQNRQRCICPRSRDET